PRPRRRPGKKGKSSNAPPRAAKEIARPRARPLPPMPPLLVVLALFLVAVIGGAQNAVAGGGSFFTFPTLLFAGVGSISANATSTVALWPGSVASAVALRDERRLFLVLGAASLAGGLAGALLLLHTPQRAFDALFPWLLLAATLVFAFGPLV